MLSLVETLARIRSGDLTPDAAIEAARRAIAAREGEVGAFVHIDPQARATGQGPLEGIAVGVKDIIDVAGLPTGMGSEIYDGWVPRADASVVALLRRAGATILGKTTTTAFAFQDPTPTRNPANPAHTPGGSSAGSAAAVAAGMVPLALGTQTGGSVIRPASFCGVAAIKPSFRLIPTVGVKCYSWTLDTVGLFAPKVGDLSVALEAITGRRMKADDTRPPRLGLLTQDFAGPVEAASVSALEKAVAVLERAGAEVVSLTPPPVMGEAWALHPKIQAFEARQALAWEYDNHRERLAPLLRAELDAAQAAAPQDYDEARRVARAARKQARDMFGELDALVTYSAPGAAPHGLGSTGEPRFNRLFTLLGTPCVNVPGLRDGNGLPVGIQVVAPFARDHVALQGGQFLELALSQQ
jgi:Asp-tRNA(Asn)/Glu-tRNA(Gln) amidotransferase A subunit family amidase